jgi:hypothetical protein
VGCEFTPTAARRFTLTADLSKLRLTLAAVLGILTLAVVPFAFAAKGGGGNGAGAPSGSSVLGLVMVTDANGDGLPNRNDQVTFNVSTTVASPYVDLSCTQSGSTVYQSSYLIGFFADFPWPWLRDVTLSSRTWTGGAANCTATLEYYNGSKLTVITSLNFDVAA